MSQRVSAFLFSWQCLPSPVSSRDSFVRIARQKSAIASTHHEAFTPARSKIHQLPVLSETRAAASTANWNSRPLSRANTGLVWCQRRGGGAGISQVCKLLSQQRHVPLPFPAILHHSFIRFYIAQETTTVCMIMRKGVGSLGPWVWAQ